jgi:hypothetical protein
LARENVAAGGAETNAFVRDVPVVANAISTTNDAAEYFIFLFKNTSL